MVSVSSRLQGFNKRINTHDAWGTPRKEFRAEERISANKYSASNSKMIDQPTRSSDNSRVNRARKMYSKGFYSSSSEDEGPAKENMRGEFSPDFSPVRKDNTQINQE